MLVPTQVSTDGVIIFDALGNFSAIAPFLTDVDTRATGNVFYRESIETDLLEDARLEIVRAFEDSAGFVPEALFVGTWDSVGYYDRNASRVRVRRKLGRGRLG